MSRRVRQTGLTLLSFLAVMRVSSACAVDYVTTLAYDLNSNIVQVNSPSGAVINYDYDFADRMTQMTYAAGGLANATISYAYDNNGNRTRMVDSTGTTIYGYDRFNRLIGVAQPGIIPTYYEYDNVGRIMLITYPTKDTIAYEYDGAGRLASATVTTKYGVYATTYGYDDNNNVLIRKTLPNGIVTTYDYDEDNRLVSSISNTISSIIAYDANSNITKTVIGGVTTNYSYDAVYALTNATSGSRREGYTYDDSGNRLMRTTEAETLRYEHDNDNRLTHSWGAISNTVYFYDADGKITLEATNESHVAFGYDAAGRLVGWSDGKTDVGFAYDGDGNRVSKTVDGVTTHYINDLASSVPQVLIEANEVYQVTGEYFYANGERLMLVRGQDVYYYHYDMPGRSVVALTDTNGTTMNSYAYDSFGNILTQNEVVQNDFKYDGEQQDEDTGLIYLRHRYYDPAIGRFISKDPYPGDLMNPITINPYPYVGNNPIIRIDPSGLSWASFSLGSTSAVINTAALIFSSDPRIALALKAAGLLTSAGTVAVAGYEYSSGKITYAEYNSTLIAELMSNITGLSSSSAAKFAEIILRAFGIVDTAVDGVQTISGDKCKSVTTNGK